MKLEILTLIPALALGWALASSHSQTEKKPLPLEQHEQSTQAAPSRSRSLNIPNQSAPISSDQCRTALEELRNQTDLHPLIQQALLDQTIRAWIEIDPTAALAFAESQVRHNYETSLDKDLFRVWVDLDPDGAKQAFSVASPALIASSFFSFFTVLGERNPEDTLNFIESRQWTPKEQFSYRYRNEQIIDHIYSNWGLRDPQAALLRAGSNEKAIQAAYTGWAKIDPLAAWNAATQEGTNVQNNHKAEAIAHLVIPAKPDLFKAFSDESTNQSKDARLFLGTDYRKIATNWVNADLDGARKFIANDNHPAFASLKTQIAHSIATADPEGAIALFQEGGGSSTSSYNNSGIFRQAFLSLNSTDPGRARELLHEIPKQHLTIALSGILTHEFASDPERAALQARQFLDDSSTAEYVIPALERALSWGHGSGNHDLTNVVAAIPELRPKVRKYLLEGWVRVAPEAAADFLAEEAHQHANQGIDFPQVDKSDNLENIATQSAGMGSAIAELSASKPEFTSAWITTLPPGEFQNKVAGSLATNWARFDRASAQAWVESLPEGPMRDQAETLLTRPFDDSVFDR